jgi:hypothetical protein
MKISPAAPTKSHAPLIFTGEPGWPISKFQEIGLSNGDWMPSYQENKSAAGQGRGEDTHRSTSEPPADKWFLLEWEFNDNPTTITMWVDGQLVPNKVGGQDVTVVPFVWPSRSQMPRLQSNPKCPIWWAATGSGVLATAFGRCLPQPPTSITTTSPSPHRESDL